MKQTLFIVFLLLFSTLFAEPATEKLVESPLSPSESQRVYEKVKPAVFQIKTAKDEQASKASYGSGFVVDADGLVLTNYHVVATVLQDEDQRYNIFLVDGNKSYRAKIVKFSVIYDIALLKVERKFDTVLTIEKKTPEHGENIYSIGKPKELNMTIVDGKYNGVIKKAIYERIQMSTPLNGGMSGGPTVNANGDVIGINVSVLLRSDNISFAVPIKNATPLLKEYRDFALSVEDEEIDAVVKEQLTEIESSLMDDLEKDKQPVATLGKWFYKAPSKSLKCWTTSDKNTKKEYDRTSHSCNLKNSAYIERGLYSGNYRIDYITVQNLKLTTFQFYNRVKSMFSSGISVNYASKDDFSGYQCNETIIVNKNDISFKVKYCITEYLRYEGLYRATIGAASFGDSEDAIIFNMDIDGFSKENIKKLIKMYLSSIGKNND
ncbi:trypsin-like peptidase domain-containing protein [bacterium]|nr:trypsin-like peptidase domain-containing protein [bacterium]